MQRNDFAALIGWLDARIGERVSASLAGPAEGQTNVVLHATGVLSRSDGDVMLIDPAPGEVVSFVVGDAVIILLEGDLVEVEFEDARRLVPPGGDPMEIPAMALADFGELMIHFSDTRREEP